MEHQQQVDILREVIFPWANFFIFLALAIFFFKKPARGAAAKARAEFERQMTEARRAREEALARLDGLKKREAGLEREIAEIRAMSKNAADAEASKIISDAGRLADHLREEARRIADAEVEKARAGLRHEIVEAVRSAVTQKIKAELGAEAHLSLVKKNIGELKNIRAEG